jgi:uncharacterized protein (DUF58 family)
MLGDHASRRIGAAVEFADYQEYRPGADLRSLDWRAWGRTDKLVVKRYVTETELPCTVVLDLSGDLSTGEAARARYPDLDGSKAGYAITLTATLLYFLQRHGEPVGLEIVAGAGMPYASLPPRRGNNHLQRAFVALAAARPAGRAELAAALARVGGRTRRRSWIAVVTDGMEEPERWLPSLAAFARRRSDLSLVHLRDPREWRLTGLASARYYSPEGGDDIAVEPEGAAQAIAEVAAEYLAEVEGGVVRWGGRYVPAPTDRPMEEVLRALVLGSASRAPERDRV